MDRFASLTGVEVPSDPLPMTISDKTILVFPRLEESSLLSRGDSAGSVGIQSDGVMQIEYHRRVPYEHLGTTMGDISTMVDTLRDLIWGELAGGKFAGTVFSISRVALVHLGALGWNEWTFGVRLETSFTYLTHVTS